LLICVIEEREMMAKGTVNKVILVGRLGQDPDIRYSPNGTAIARFSLATNERVPAGEGNWEDKTEWHRIVAFAKLAEVCGNYLAKGRLVFVEGSIRSGQWEDAQGQKRISYDIVARDIQMLGGGEGQGQAQTQGNAQPVRSSGQAGRNAIEELPPNMGPPDDDIPF
jgi:single-strand DNA-binding protein